MPSWERFDENWQRWVETFPSGKCMDCYRHPKGYQYPENDHVMPAGWVSVKAFASAPYGKELEKNCIERPCGWLEIECIMHEMRAKYGAT